MFLKFWCIVASGTKEQTNIVVKNGAIPQLVELLDSSYQTIDAKIVDHIVWVLANISCECAVGVIQEKDLLPNIVNVCDLCDKNLLASTKMEDKTALSLIIETLTDVSALVENILYFAGDTLSKNTFQIILQTIANTLSMYDINDNDFYNITRGCTRAIYWSMKKNYEFDEVEVLINTDIVSKLFPYFNKILNRIILDRSREKAIRSDINDNDNSYNLFGLVVEIFAAVCGGTHEQTQYIINAGILQEINKLLTHVDENIQFHTINANGLLRPENKIVINYIMLMISNIAGGTVIQTQIMIDCGILKLLIKFLEMDSFELRTKKEITWSLRNATTREPSATNILTWQIERLFWIAHFKNSNLNGQCLLSKLPKDIILFVLSFLNSKFDQIYTNKQINLQEKRNLQIEYLVDECGLLNAWFALLSKLNGDQWKINWLEIALEGLLSVLDCGVYLQKKYEFEDNKYWSVFEKMGGVEIVKFIIIFIIICIYFACLYYSCQCDYELYDSCSKFKKVKM